MDKKAKYKNKLSGQVSRKRKRHGKKNRPRLERLKQEFGCYICGRDDVPGRYLDGHHYYGKDKKHKALSALCDGPWRKVIDEIVGIDREKGRSGGPVVMICQRYHEDEIKNGACAKPCTHPCFEKLREPYRVKTRLPGRIRSQVEGDVLENSIRSIGSQSSTPQHGLGAWRQKLSELKNWILNLNLKLKN
jgi:hypothetical protein